MLKIVYPICCGIDVHKKFVVATISSTNDENITSYQTRQFSTFNSDLQQLKQWLLSNDCKDVCMESTGKYWIPVFNILEDSIHVIIANPKYLKAIRGKKTDKKDSIWISDLFKHDLVPSSYIPPKPIRMLRDLTRYRSKLVSNRSSEKNRIQNSLTISNIALASVVSDTFGKSATAIIEYLTSSEEFSIEHCKSLLQKSLKKKSDEVINSILGYELSNEQSSKIKICRQHFDYIDECISTLNENIISLSKPYLNQINLLTTIPGITEKSAISIISEIGIDMSVFKDSKHLCSWAGLTPQNNESAGKKKSSRTSRAGVYLKPLLVECSLASLKSNANPYFREKYNRIKKRRGHKKAIIAISRMMLTCIFHMLSNNQEFMPKDINYSDISEEILQKHQTQIIDSAIILLQKQGFTITKDDVIYATN